MRAQEPEPHEKKPDVQLLRIFVNRRPFDRADGVKDVMTIDELAQLIGLAGADVVIRRVHGSGQHPSDALSGPIDVKNGDQFSVIRQNVNGGFTNRVDEEIAILKNSGLEVERIAEGPGYVLYKSLPAGAGGMDTSDVIVPVPTGYPAAMIDWAALPVGSPLLGKVKGAPQHVFTAAGREWRMVSYHPHAGGGAPPWNPSTHGFHTYLTELLAWLEVR